MACICVSCQAIRDTLEPLVGSPITVTAIVDLMNHIGRCVVSGNVRQTAEIAFGDPLSEEYINLKDYDVNPHRAAYGWTSNNSVFAKLGMDYGPVVDRVLKNGEPGGCKACLTQAACARTQVDVCCPPPPPASHLFTSLFPLPPSPFPFPSVRCMPGFAWLENMQGFSRMKGEPDFKDRRAAGGNPCLEQTLESYELCCLVETFPNNHTSFEDFRRTLKVRACVVFGGAGVTAMVVVSSSAMLLWMLRHVQQCGC